MWLPEVYMADPVPWPQTFGARPEVCPHCRRGNPHWRTVVIVNHYPSLRQSILAYLYECRECGHTWTHRYY